MNADEKRVADKPPRWTPEALFAAGFLVFMLGLAASTVVAALQEEPKHKAVELPKDECICGEVRPCVSDGKAVFQQCVGDPKNRVSKWSRCLTPEGEEP